MGLGAMPPRSCWSCKIPALICSLFCLPFLPGPAPAAAIACLREAHGLHALPVLPHEGHGVPGLPALRVGAPGRVPEEGVWGKHQNDRCPKTQVSPAWGSVGQCFPDCALDLSAEMLRLSLEQIWRSVTCRLLKPQVCWFSILCLFTISFLPGLW